MRNPMEPKIVIEANVYANELHPLLIITTDNESAPHPARCSWILGQYTYLLINASLGNKTCI